VTDGLCHGALAALLDDPALRRLLAVLNRDGEETRIVGGAVRNALLGRPVADLDCTTTAAPGTVVERARAAGFKTVPTGIEHGTVTVIVDGEPFEVTSLREDVETDGRRAVVRFGRDFAADARRRDFTINALSLDAEGRLHDYAGGLTDLAARRVRFIGDAHTRIREDYLRILRFFRFHAEYGLGDPDPEGLAAALGEREGIARLSAERIRAEMLKLLGARRAVVVVGVMADYGFLNRLLGGLVERGRLARVAAAEADASDPVRRLAALAVMTEEDAERLRERLRLSNGEHRRLHLYAELLALLKTRSDPVDAQAMRRLVANHGPDTVFDALASLSGEPRPVVTEAAVLALRRYRSGEDPVPVFAAHGRDLVAMGVEKGPRIGALLEEARRAWLAQGCPTGPEAARTLLREALSRAQP
jgi:poly(A) polymerase